MADRDAVGRRHRRRHQPGQQRGRDRGGADHQPGHQAVDLGPAPAAALLAVGPDQRDAARQDHRQTVARHRHRRTQAAFVCRQQVGAVGVDHHVLRRRHERDRDRQQRECLRRALGRGAGEHEEPQRQRQLRRDQPAAPPTQPRQVEAVHQRRPQELEGVGQADQAQEADRRDIQALDRQPGLHRLPGQRQRQARREAEQRDDEQPVQRGQALRGRARDRVGSSRGGRHRGHSRQPTQPASSRPGHSPQRAAALAGIGAGCCL